MAAEKSAFEAPAQVTARRRRRLHCVTAVGGWTAGGRGQLAGRVFANSQATVSNVVVSRGVRAPAAAAGRGNVTFAQTMAPMAGSDGGGNLTMMQTAPAGDVRRAR